MGGQLGVKLTDEHKESMRHPKTVEHAQAISRGKKGKKVKSGPRGPHTDERKRAIAESKRGKKRVFTSQHIENMRKAQQIRRIKEADNE